MQIFSFFPQHSQVPIPKHFNFRSTYPRLRVEGDLGGPGRREDIGVALENDAGEHLDERLVGEDEQHLAQQEERGHLPNLRLHILAKRETTVTNEM